MNKITLHEKQFSPYLSEDQIQSRIKEMAAQIASDYQNKTPYFICVLNGSLFFTSDLVKNYDQPCYVHSVKCKSYEGVSSTGSLKIELDFPEELKSKDVIILEDIVDTGLTLHELLKRLEELKPASVKIASLLLKPECLKHPLNIDYTGFEIPNAFVVGYGLDYDGLGRNYKDIYQLSV